MLRNLASGTVRAIFRPERRARTTDFLRAFVRLRGIFDLTSLVIQTIDISRLRRITEGYSVEQDYLREVHDYNASVSLKKTVTFTRRAEIHYEMLTASPPRSVDGESLLIVGPRNRHELLMAWCHGYAWNRIFAIDLYSTHPKIVTMNMEKMTFPDASFDAVVMANTLAYASDTDAALGEAARVLRPGGRFSFGATYEPVNQTWRGNAVSARAIVDRLHALGMEISSHYAVDKINALGKRQTNHFIVARKPLVDEQRLDAFAL
jgi:SAM-dependent methyltransferase